MKRSAFSLFSALALVLILSGLALAQQPVNLIDISGTAPTTAGFLDIKGADGNVFVRCNAASTCPVNANESGTWSVRMQDTAGNGITTDSTTFTSKFALDTNLLGTLGTAFTTAGLVDIKGTDGNVFVRSTTAANFLAKVDLVGNAGAIMDFAGQNASSPANALQIGGQFNTTPTTLTTGDSSPLQLDNSGKLLVNCTGCSAGSTVGLVPQTSGGLTLSHLIAAATTNATVLKASAGQLYGAAIYNNATYPVYLKFYNTASAPTVGTTTVVYEVPVQAGTEREVHTDEGLAFATGIAYALTKGIADTDTTATAISDASMDLIYK